MNVRKNIDYSAMFTALDTLMATDIPQMELYYEIGRLVSDRQEKGAAVAAAEHLQGAYPDAAGFSPRNLRRMREFYRIYADAPEMMNEAMSLGWTQNIIILEADLTMQERLWYIRAALRFGWSKSVLVQKINAAAHLSLDAAEEICYTEERAPVREVPDSAEAAASQRTRTESCNTADGVFSILFLVDPHLLYQKTHTSPLPVCRRRGWTMRMGGSGPPG